MARKDKDLELWQEWKSNPSDETLTPLLGSFQGMINKRVNEFSGAPVPRAALEGFANAQTVKAFHSYNPSKGAALHTHVGWNLKKLQSFSAEHQNLGKIPDHRVSKITKFKQAKVELHEELGRPPDTLMLADRLGWSPAEVGRMQSELRSDNIASLSLESDSLAESDSMHERDVLRYIHYDLTPDERLVYEYSLGLYGKPKLSAGEIAKQMKISPSKVSRIRTKIDKKLEKRGV